MRALFAWLRVLGEASLLLFMLWLLWCGSPA